MALNFDAIHAVTRKKYIPELKDNYFKSHALLALLKDKAYKPFTGSEIVEPLIYAGLSNVASYAAYDTLTYDQSIPITAAQFDWRHLAAPVIYSKPEEIANYGSDAQVEDLIESKMKIAQLTLNAAFATQLYADGTGNTNKDIIGLGAMINTSGVYGGIDRGTYTWWNAIVSANGGQARPLTTRLMRSMYLSLADGDDKPGLILTTDKLWNRYAEMAEGKLVISSKEGKMLADLGFQVLEFMGTPIIADKDCPAGTMKFLNLKYIKLRHSPIANFDVTKLHQADNMVAFKQEILWSGNLTCANCRRQGEITDLDESQY